MEHVIKSINNNASQTFPLQSFTKLAAASSHSFIVSKTNEVEIAIIRSVCSQNNMLVEETVSVCSKAVKIQEALS